MTFNKFQILWLVKVYSLISSWYLKLDCKAIDPVIKSWFELIQHRIDTRGTVDTIDHVKACRLCYTRYLCGQPFTESPGSGVRITSDGLPICGLLTDFMRRDDLASKRLVHSLLLVSRCLPGSKAPNLTTVTSPSTSVNSYEFKSEIDAVVKQLGWGMPKPVWESVHLSTKAGPNGQAMMGAMSDLHLLSDRMLQNMEYMTDGKVNQQIEQLRPLSLDLFNKQFNLKPKGLLSKLSLIKDKEAKARIIAILDYWTQSTLRPLHLGLFSLLKRIKGDCTFNQASFVTHLPKTGPYFSFDLTAATDRFPLEFQRLVLAAVVGDEKYSTSWAELISDRDFYVPWEDGLVRYQCGQPMGAYSSWAVFALAHHVVVRIAAKRVGLNPSFCSYALLGDDIVLTNNDVAQEYLNIMSQLGVSISESKTHVSNDTYEFAKRWIHRGQEMTGLPINLIVDNRRKLKWFTAAQWIKEIESRWCAKDGLATRSLFAKLYVLLGVQAGYSARLAQKAYNFYHLPNKGDSYNLLLTKALYFSRQFFDNCVGCNRSRFTLTLMWEWLAEAKTSVIEEAIKDQTKLLNQFLSELVNLVGLVPEGMDAQSVLRTLVPVQVVLNNLGDLQGSFEKLRADFTSGREKRIVLDSSSYARAVNPTRVYSKRQSELVMYSNASIVNKFNKLASIYVKGRSDLISGRLSTDDIEG